MRHELLFTRVEEIAWHFENKERLGKVCNSQAAQVAVFVI
jgi:hypothetical protein